MNKALGTLGLAKKAGKLEVGEEPVAAAVRAKAARLLLFAADAADNSVRRIRHFADVGACILLPLPCSKDELGGAVGRTSCAMVAVTDIGFASAIVKKLAEGDPAQYEEALAKLQVKADRAAQRRKEKLQHEKNVRSGRVKPKNAEAPAPQVPEQHSETKKSRPAGKPHTPANRSAKRQAPRFAHARPVKKGKGSVKKEKP